MSADAIIIALVALMIGILVGMLMSPTIEIRLVRRCDCGNRWPGLMKYGSSYHVGCDLCGRTGTSQNTIPEAIRAWNRS